MLAIGSFAFGLVKLLPLVGVWVFNGRHHCCAICVLVQFFVPRYLRALLSFLFALVD
jgi:hypothetical protein